MTELYMKDLNQNQEGIEWQLMKLKVHKDPDYACLQEGPPTVAGHWICWTQNWHLGVMEEDVPHSCQHLDYSVWEYCQCVLCS